jgi:AraC-like DNA-binding protein
MTGALPALISRCQVVAGHFGEVAPATLVREVRRLVADLPPVASRAEQLVIGDVLDRVLARLVRYLALDNCPDIAQRFVKLAAARAMPDIWRTEWAHIADLCTTLISSRLDPGTHHIDSRVIRMLEVIDERYADATLNARSAAKAANLSAWHGARLLKHQSGCGFLTHLHRRRIAVACDLLRDYSRSIKEISTAVGYAHPSQFSRHFKLAFGITPFTFRSSPRPTRSS